MKLNFPISIGDVVRIGESGTVGLVESEDSNCGDRLCRVRLTKGGSFYWHLADDLEKIDRIAVYRDAVGTLESGTNNLSRLAHLLSRHLPYIWWEVREFGGGTREVNKHPAVVLFVSQMFCLAAGDCIDGSVFSQELAICRKRLEPGQGVSP